VRFIKPPFQLVPGYISPEIMRPEPEADLSLQSSAKVKNTWSRIPTPPYALTVCTTAILYYFSLLFQHSSLSRCSSLVKSAVHQLLRVVRIFYFVRHCSSNTIQQNNFTTFLQSSTFATLIIYCRPVPVTARSKGVGLRPLAC
jgi:hypothetical protein